MNLYWGDLHAHSGFSKCFWPDCGSGDLDELYTYARNTGKLDFCAACDHDIHMSDEQWQHVQETVGRHRDPGAFIALLGFEWTSYAYGHHNVYYPGITGPLYRCNTQDGTPLSPQHLFEQLGETEALVIPHHPAVTQFRVHWDTNHSPRLKHLEITSLWGNSDIFGTPHPARISDTLPGYHAIDQLLAGRRIGFVGGSDSHDNCPGDVTFCGRQKVNGQDFAANPIGVLPARHICDATANTRGLTAVLAESLSADSLWNALHARRTYATTGARIACHITANDLPIGTETTFPADGAVRLSIDITGTAPLRAVRLIRNGHCIAHVPTTDNRATLQFVDHPDPAMEAWYYCVVEQEDGHRAWTSPIWFCPPGSSRAPDDCAGLSAELLQCQLARVADSTPRPTLESQNTPACIRHSTHGDIHRFLLQWDGTAETCTGIFRLADGMRYVARDVNFACKKFGGDLFTDNHDGLLRWHLYAGTTKGIEVFAAPAANTSVGFRAEIFCDDTPVDVEDPQNNHHTRAFCWTHPASS